MARSQEARVLGAYIETLRRLLAPFIDTPVKPTRATRQEPYLLTLAAPRALIRRSQLRLAFEQYVTVAGDSIELVGYRYRLDVGDGRELISYHWHPETPPDFPHLHLGHAAAVQWAALTEAHIPTGPVTSEDVVRLLIELGIGPGR